MSPLPAPAQLNRLQQHQHLLVRPPVLVRTFSRRPSLRASPPAASPVFDVELGNGPNGCVRLSVLPQRSCRLESIDLILRRHSSLQARKCWCQPQLRSLWCRPADRRSGTRRSGNYKLQQMVLPVLIVSSAWLARTVMLMVHAMNAMHVTWHIDAYNPNLGCGRLSLHKVA